MLTLKMLHSLLLVMIEPTASVSALHSFFHHLFFYHLASPLPYTDVQVQMLPGQTRWRHLHIMLPHLSASELFTSPSRNLTIFHYTPPEQKVFAAVSKHPQTGHLSADLTVFVSFTPLCFGSCLLTSNADTYLKKPHWDFHVFILYSG